MAIIFDVINKVIEVESPDTEISIQNLINAIRDFEDTPEGIMMASIANASGKQSLGPGKSVGITLELINDWRVQFEEKETPTFCYIRGGNLVATNQYSNNPLKASINVNMVVELSTSASIDGGDIWDKPTSEMTTEGTIGAEINKIDQTVKLLKNLSL